VHEQAPHLAVKCLLPPRTTGQRHVPLQALADRLTAQPNQNSGRHIEPNLNFQTPAQSLQKCNPEARLCGDRRDPRCKVKDAPATIRICASTNAPTPYSLANQLPPESRGKRRCIHEPHSALSAMVQTSACAARRRLRAMIRSFPPHRRIRHKVFCHWPQASHSFKNGLATLPLNSDRHNWPASTSTRSPSGEG